MKSLSRFAGLACALLAGASLALAAPRAPAPKAPSRPKQYNQFATVDELIKARRPAKALVSTEGYIVCAWAAPGGSVRMSLTDSVDHVLNANDALGAQRSGLSATAASASVKRNPRWALTDKGLRRLAMFAGSAKGKPTKMLHDTVPRVRVTGTMAGRGVMGAVTIIEYADDNGDWKKL